MCVCEREREGVHLVRTESREASKDNWHRQRNTEANSKRLPLVKDEIAWTSVGMVMKVDWYIYIKFVSSCDPKNAIFVRYQWVTN